MDCSRGQEGRQMVPSINWKFVALLICIKIACLDSTTSVFGQINFSNRPIGSSLFVSGSNGTSKNDVDFGQALKSDTRKGYGATEVAPIKVSKPLPGDSLINPPNGNSLNQAVIAQEPQIPQSTITTEGETLLTGHFYMAFDFMFLRRSGPSPQVLVVTDGVPSLNSADFSYDATFSPRFVIGLGDPNGYAFEFLYMSSSHDFDGVLAGTAVTPIFFGGIPAAPVSSYTVDAESQLNNYEINQWVRLNDRSRLGLGLRIIDMHDEYNITETGTNSGFFCTAENQLLGGQFAGQYIFVSNEIAMVYFQGKAGLFWNHASVDATSANAQITPDTDEFSFVGDLRIVADFPVTRLISMRAGYHAQLLTNIAQALDQNDDLSIFNPAAPGNFDFSSPWYHGMFFGIVGSY